MPINTINAVLFFKKFYFLIAIVAAFFVGKIDGQNTLPINESGYANSATVVEQNADTLLISIVSGGLEINDDSFVIVGREWNPSFIEGLFNPPSAFAKKIKLNAD